MAFPAACATAFNPSVAAFRPRRGPLIAVPVLRVLETFFAEVLVFDRALVPRDAVERFFADCTGRAAERATERAALLTDCAPFRPRRVTLPPVVPPRFDFPR